MSAKRVVVANQKGGAGKTTTAWELGAVLARAGQSVVFIDMDPQFALTDALGGQGRGVGIGDVLQGQAALESVLVDTTIPGTRLAPVVGDLAATELGLVSVVRREERLARALADFDDGDVDVIIIDCPPNRGTLTVNALVAADTVVCPVSCQDKKSLDGVAGLLTTVRELYDGYEPPKIKAVLTRWDPRRDAAVTVAEAIYQYPVEVSDVRIPEAAAFHKAPMRNPPEAVCVRTPDSLGGVAYWKLARELGFGKVAV